MAFAILSCARQTSNVPRASENAGHKHLFRLLFWVKPALLAQTQVEILTINISLPHSDFSFRTVAVQEEDNFGASGEFLSSP